MMILLSIILTFRRYDGG